MCESLHRPRIRCDPSGGSSESKVRERKDGEEERGEHLLQRHVHVIVTDTLLMNYCLLAKAEVARVGKLDPPP